MENISCGKIRGNLESWLQSRMSQNESSEGVDVNMEVEGSTRREAAEGEDGFSFRPQREKTGTRLHQFSPARSFKRHSKRFRPETQQR